MLVASSGGGAGDKATADFLLQVTNACKGLGASLTKAAMSLHVQLLIWYLQIKKVQLDRERLFQENEDQASELLAP